MKSKEYSGNKREKLSERRTLEKRRSIGDKKFRPLEDGDDRDTDGPDHFYFDDYLDSTNSGDL